jgi:hypothetical protein
MTFARSKSEHVDEVSAKHKIVVFSRNSLKSNISKSMHQLEINAIYDLDEGVPTSRIYPQDDCLHTERAPLRSPLHGSALHVREQYNFHQGLVNTKEVLEMQGCAGNANITPFAASTGSGQATAHCTLSDQD